MFLSVSPEVSFRTPTRIGQRLGKETLLECFVAAFPHGVSQWKKNGIQVPAHDAWKYKTDIYKEDHLTVALYLRIVNLEPEDFGRYTCEAQNRLGKDSDSMYLFGKLIDQYIHYNSYYSLSPYNAFPYLLTRGR